MHYSYTIQRITSVAQDPRSHIMQIISRITDHFKHFILQDDRKYYIIYLISCSSLN